MAQYKPLSGENVFDVAVKLYGDVTLGVRDLMELNEITVDQDLFGTTLEYTEGLTRNKIPSAAVMSREMVTIYKTISLQTVYDLAIQLYGDISKIGNLIRNFSNLDDNISIGESFEIGEQIDPIAVYFRDNRLNVATDFVVGSIFRRVDTANTDLRITESGDIRIVML